MTAGDRWQLPSLTFDDRCDFACNSPAVLRLVCMTGDLYACAMHVTKHEIRLREVAVYVQDERMEPLTDMSDMEELGRMHMRRGLTHRDPCRWCTQRLVNRRTFTNGRWRDYFMCPTCDETAAPDMESLKGLIA